MLLRQPVGNGVPRSRVGANAEVAGEHFDVLDAVRMIVRLLLDAGRPRHHAISFGIEAGERHRRRRGELVQHQFVRQRFAGEHRVHTPGVGGARALGKRGAERDHVAYRVRHLLRDLACVDTAEAPANQRHRLAIVTMHGHELLTHALKHALRGPRLTP